MASTRMQATGRVGRAVLAAAAIAVVLVALPDAASARAVQVAGDAPVATADSFLAVSGIEKVFPAPGVLANDTDADGDALTASIVTGASTGSLSLRDDGGFTYSSPLGFTGTVTFAYRSFDGTDLSDTVQASIVVRSQSAAFVGAIYEDLLSRSAEPAGTAFWAGRLDRGAETRTSFVLQMSRSHEYSVKVVNRAFVEVLGRPVDPSGREFWARRVQKGMPVAGLVLQLIASNEFVTKSGGTVAGFVDAAYEAILDRAPTSSERSAGIARLEGGGRRVKLVSELYASTESRARRVRVQYQDMLHREPTTLELSSAVAKLGTWSGSDINLAIALASGTEYFEVAISQ